MKSSFLRKQNSTWYERPHEFGSMWRDEVLAPSGLYTFAELFQRVTGQRPNISLFLQSILANLEAGHAGGL
ncbi:MAG: hypothetical protein ACK5Y2_03785 [Bdellovibrionales bacterium]